MAYEAKLLVGNEQRSLLTFRIHYFEGRTGTIMNWYDNNPNYYNRTLDSLREVIKSDLHAFRFVAGQPYGGLLELTMESTSQDDFFYDWFVPSQRFGTTMKNGVIEFYNDGEEAVPFKRIEFWDAWISDITLNMNSTGNDPMTIKLRISPATIRYNKSHVIRKTWYETDITQLVDSIPKMAEASYPTTTPVSSSVTSAAKSSNKFGKIAEGALGTIVTAAAAALSKKSTQEALKGKFQSGLESVMEAVTKEESKFTVTKMYWMDEEEKEYLNKVNIGQTAIFFAQTKDYEAGKNMVFPIKDEDTGKITNLKGKIGDDGLVKITWTNEA